MRRIALPTAAVLMLMACAGGPPPDSSREPLETTAVDSGNQPPAGSETRAVRQVLAQAQQDPTKLESLYLFVECQGDEGLRTLEAFGSGVGIWEGRRQFELSEADLLELTRRLAAADFAALEDLYGGPAAADLSEPDKPDPDFGVEIICRIELTLDGVTKTSAQRRQGERSAELKQLADDLIAQVQGQARHGVEADDLVDGLEKLGNGELAPETMLLMLHQRPEAGDADGGFLLRVAGLEARNSTWSRDAGYADPVVLALAPPEVAALALDLARTTPDDLPINLYADTLNDVVIQVLNHKVTLQARRFAGMTPDQHGDQQQRFDALVQSLVGLGQRVLAEGAGDSRP